MQKSFFFEGSQIHRMSQVHQDHKYVIQIGPSHFRYSKSQLALLSNKALKHFRHSQSPFEISLPNDETNFGLDELIACFKAIDSLFRSEAEIILNENNLPAFEYISRVLDKRSLSQSCKHIHSNISPIFKLSSKHFKFLYESDITKLNDFQLMINGKSFGINFSLFCCVSDKFQAMNHQEQELRLTIPDQHLPCLISFLDIFKGLPFYFENYSPESVSYFIHLFGLSSLAQFIYENCPSPQNIQEVLEFLSSHSCEFYPNIFDESLTILIRHFSEIRTDQILKLSNFILGKLFQSPQFLVDNEDTLFDLVVELIERDPNRKILLKYVYFPGVSSSHLINFLNNFPIEEIDSDLFESIKTRLFCEVLQPNSVPSLRWRNLPTFLSKEKIDNIYQLLQDHFHDASNPVELIQTLLGETEKMKSQLENLQSEREIMKTENIQMKNYLHNVQNENIQMKNYLQNVQNENVQMKNYFHNVQNTNEEMKIENFQLKNENQELKIENEGLTQSVQTQHKEIENLRKHTKEVLINLTGCSGIIFSLKQTDPNPVILTSSSNYYPDRPHKLS
jgi:hypothetical protein